MSSAGDDISATWEELARPGGRIVYLVLDGAGGLRDPDSGTTALETAATPYLDLIATESATGLLELVGPGITPGSGPGHLALFGYDPLRFRIGRGVLAALGSDFALQPGDVAARVNFATIDDQGRVTDRRAGRITSAENRRLCERIRSTVRLDFAGEYFLQTVAEHRAVLVLRGENLCGDLQDTDPQRTGAAPHAPVARTAAARPTAELVSNFLAQAHAALAGERPANALLLRGFQQHAPLPTLAERYRLEGCFCMAQYPMYRGLSRLLGMDVVPPPSDMSTALDLLERHYGEKRDLFFLHVKETDKSGEDSDFQRKVAALEAVDRQLFRLIALEPDVLVVTADHSTPALMGGHSWHPVPVMIRSATARVDEVARFDEYACRAGSLGLRPGVHLMGLALAHAGRLAKFGA